MDAWVGAKFGGQDYVVIRTTPNFTTLCNGEVLLQV